MFPLFRNNLHLDEHFVGGGSFRQGKPRNEESSVFGNGFDGHGRSFWEVSETITNSLAMW